MIPYMSASVCFSLPKQRLLWLIFVLFSLAGAVNILEVHTRHGLIAGAVYDLCIAVLSYWLLFYKHHRWFGSALGSLALWLVVFAVLGVLDQRHNHKVEAEGHPMTTSLALEYPARALMHGHEMYSVTANGAPISPGPGWILFWSPLTVPGWTGLLCVVSLAAVFVLLHRRNAVGSGLFTCLMLAQPLFLSQMANGQDLFVISFALIALIPLTGRVSA